MYYFFTVTMIFSLKFLCEALPLKLKLMLRPLFFCTQVQESHRIFMYKFYLFHGSAYIYGMLLEPFHMQRSNIIFTTFWAYV